MPYCRFVANAPEGRGVCLFGCCRQCRIKVLEFRTLFLGNYGARFGHGDCIPCVEHWNRPALYYISPISKIRRISKSTVALAYSYLTYWPTQGRWRLFNCLARLRRRRWHCPLSRSDRNAVNATCDRTGCTEQVRFIDVTFGYRISHGNDAKQSRSDDLEDDQSR
jgi:hypothetical protein